MSPEDVVLHSKWMRRLARALVGDAAADDVVQDAWARLGERREAPGYLAAIVRSLARDRRRGESRRVVRERRAARTEALPSTEEIAARSELARRLAAAVEELDEPFRTTIVLRYYDDLSSAEIARRTGTPEGTVRARLKRGLDRLRERLDAQGGGRERWVSALLPLARPRPPKVGPVLGTSLTLLASMKTAATVVLLLTASLVVWKVVGAGDSPARTVTLVGDESAGIAPVGEVASDGRRAAGREELVDAGARPAGSAASVPGEPDRILARTLDPLGLPLRGGWVRLHAVPEPFATAGPTGHVELSLAAGGLEQRATLDGNRQVVIDVGAPGRRTRTLRSYLSEEASKGPRTLELGDVVLEPGSAVEGRVIDASGRAIEGALVVVGATVEGWLPEQSARSGPPDLAMNAWSGRDPALTARSDALGAFRIEGLAAGYATAWARTRTSRWAFSEPIGLRPGEEALGIELVVSEASAETFSGRVLDPGGNALPGIEVTFAASVGEQGWSDQRTDEHGDFHFVAEEAMDITVRSPSWEWEDRVVREVQPGTHDLVIAFEASRWLPVLVQGEDGRPVRAGRVVGLPADGPTTYAVPRFDSTIDSAGRARIRRGTEPLRLRAESPGYRDALFGPFTPEAWPDPLVLTLEPVPALLGRVTHHDGRPAAGARVSLHLGPSPGKGPYFSHQGWGGDGEPFVYTVRPDAMASCVADDEGRYRLPLPGIDAKAEGEVADESPMAGLGYAGAANVVRKPRTGGWFVHAQLDGAASITEGPNVFTGPEDVVLDLRLPSSGAIAGHLVLDDGSSTVGWTAWATDGHADCRSAAVGANGTFHLENLGPGGWQVRVFEPGKRHYPDGGRVYTDRVPVADVEVVAGRTVAYEHVARRQEAARLRGRVTFDGRPTGPAHVRVATTLGRGSFASVETTLDPDGRFEVLLRPDLETTVSVFRSGLSVSAKVTIVPGENDWAADIPTARLEGSVAPRHFERRGWGAGLSYAVERDGLRAQVTWTPEEDGRFDPLVVPSGPGVLRGPMRSHREPAEVLAELDLEPGETHILAIE
jgi:RNA polymerase sigma-70 factor (ECF subfamily)